VACGPGNFSRDFARAVSGEGLVVGLDASPTMLARAVRDTRGPGAAQVAYVRADATALPFRDASFDAVCCFAALHLFADPPTALDEMARVLTPGGRIALMTSCRTASRPGRALDGLLGAVGGFTMFERDEVTAALANRGFADVHQRVAGLVQVVGGRLAS
jgi:ubiquinone/menaquinone biosynthesis C-methylase UbiE